MSRRSASISSERPWQFISQTPTKEPFGNVRSRWNCHSSLAESQSSIASSNRYTQHPKPDALSACTCTSVCPHLCHLATVATRVLTPVPVPRLCLGSLCAHTCAILPLWPRLHSRLCRFHVCAWGRFKLLYFSLLC